MALLPAREAVPQQPSLALQLKKEHAYPQGQQAHFDALLARTRAGIRLNRQEQEGILLWYKRGVVHVTKLTKPQIAIRNAPPPP